ncbi:MAG: carotenoid biosynthesis protein [Tannerellaceae bacterium]|nr:carotenoid biosynthesis protein [Tannerellaceae bacterium]
MVVDKAWIIRFYAVGYLLFVLPWTHNWFVALTPLSLLLAIGVVFYYHTDWRRIVWLWFAFIIVSSFGLEMIGVNSGAVFGVYRYEDGLGVKWNGTPLIIGLNWLFLVYASRSIVVCRLHTAWLRIVTGAVLMIVYDLLLEWVAPLMRMWHFDGGYPPPANFITWFIAALVYHTGFEFLGIQTASNAPARWLFVVQWLFFLLIAMYNLLFSV